MHQPSQRSLEEKPRRFAEGEAREPHHSPLPRIRPAQALRSAPRTFTQTRPASRTRLRPSPGSAPTPGSALTLGTVAPPLDPAYPPRPCMCARPSSAAYLRLRRPRLSRHGEPGLVQGGRRSGRQAPGTRGIRRVPVEGLHEGHFHLCHRHRGGLRPADIHPEEVPIPLEVERAGGCGCRLSGQLQGHPRGDPEMQQPLALPGNGAAPQRHEHRSAQLGELHRSCRRYPGPQPPSQSPPHAGLCTPQCPSQHHVDTCGQVPQTCADGHPGPGGQTRKSFPGKLLYFFWP